LSLECRKPWLLWISRKAFCECPLLRFDSFLFFIFVIFSVVFCRRSNNKRIVYNTSNKKITSLTNNLLPNCSDRTWGGWLSDFYSKVSFECQPRVERIKKRVKKVEKCAKQIKVNYFEVKKGGKHPVREISRKRRWYEATVGIIAKSSRFN
jgi:hypothetical protein